MASYIVNPGDTFNAIATRFGVTQSALVAANPDVADPNRIFPGQVLTIPGAPPAAGSNYVVQSGDTLSAIANRFGTTVSALDNANPVIADPNRIFAGHVLAIPRAVPAAGSRYVVQAGDTLSAIGSRFGVGVAALVGANPQLADPNRIFTGQVLAIAGPRPVPGPEYVVQAGDTLTAIATRFGTTVAAVDAANPQIADPNRIFTGQIIVTEARVFRRSNIWTLHDSNPWHPVIDAYARGVRALRARSDADEMDPRGWRYQAAVHGTTVNPDSFRNQCQHFSWYFLPWHRMYLEWFERLVRGAIQDLPEVDELTKQTWALPYWNYSSTDVNRRRLPAAFLDLTMPDGTPNPLRHPNRTLNNGAPLTATAVDLRFALAPTTFAGVSAFAGERTGFSHAGDGNSVGGPLEGAPHGAVHVQVGGDMGGFNTAALDPIFWLHHANIDRIWEVWRGMPDRANTDEAAWLSGVPFRFHDENGGQLTENVRDVLETVDQLHYRYEDTSAPVQRESAVAPTPEPEFPPELVGATDAPTPLTADRATVTVGLSAPEGPVAESVAGPSRALLRLENVTAPEPVPLTYAVYLDAPDGDPATDDTHLIGVASFFGIEDTADPDNEHGGMQLVYDITELYHRLRAEGRWTDSVRVTFVAQYVESPQTPARMPADESLAPQHPGDVRIGRVSVFLQ
mgnify:CR=1 FL=1